MEKPQKIVTSVGMGKGDVEMGPNNSNAQEAGERVGVHPRINIGA